MKKLLVLSLLIFGLAGCDDPHDNNPVRSANFHIDKDGSMGQVGGGDGYATTHWERYIDDRKGNTIICFNPNGMSGGTSTNIACVDEGYQ